MDKTLITGPRAALHLKNPRFHPFQPHCSHYPIAHAGHTAQTLSPLLLYLRELARPGHALHLDGIDPALAVNVLLDLVRLSQHGVHVRLVTHHDHVLERLSTLHWFTRLSPRRHHRMRAATYNLTADSNDFHIVHRGQNLGLHNARIGCWRLTPPEGRWPGAEHTSRLRKLRPDPSNGMYDKHGDLDLRLYNEFVDISNAAP